jgi:hypothetical protein
MDQETGIRPLYDEFFQGYEAVIRLFCPDFSSNATYKRNSTRNSSESAVMLDGNDSAGLTWTGSGLIKVCRNRG